MVGKGLNIKSPGWNTQNDRMTDAQTETGFYQYRLSILSFDFLIDNVKLAEINVRSINHIYMRSDLIRW